MKYGRQFEVRSCATVLLATEQGIRRYPGSGLISRASARSWPSGVLFLGQQRGRSLNE